MKNVKVPVYLFYAANDWLSDMKDVLRLYGELGNPKAAVLIPDLYFNHLDFIFGIDAKMLLYDNIVALMNTYNKDLRIIDFETHIDERQNFAP